MTIHETFFLEYLNAIVPFNENEIAILGHDNLTQRKVCLYDTTKIKDCWRKLPCQWNNSALNVRNDSLYHNEI